MTHPWRHSRPGWTTWSRWRWTCSWKGIGLNELPIQTFLWFYSSLLHSSLPDKHQAPEMAGHRQSTVKCSEIELRSTAGSPCSSRDQKHHVWFAEVSFRQLLLLLLNWSEWPHDLRFVLVVPQGWLRTGICQAQHITGCFRAEPTLL